MSKLLSLKHWVHVFKRVGRLLVSSRVPMKEKLLFVVPAALYWVLPDVIPFLPIDDIAVTMLLANWFATRFEKKYRL
ncbi:hypothetical protein J31TS4_13650 [Paenibacillus sp. J31TS4]|uniref:hypothetical protein n=1 Tax=Paenibacillus sp. J31TS4 TaxID=2807195 RepID=UPI001B1AB545|nr:hypothetical protein [Paenibacillus sp. J31TS4]GIP38085.1 hypothetical protein J31TS4_13650 [Paenibacillus sp. J31TS4]